MYFEDYKIGTEFKLKPVEIKLDKILEFSREYDPLPIHLDEEFAKKSKFKKIIASGIMSFMTVWSEFVKLNVWGDSLIAGKSSNIEWHAPVFAGDILTGTIIITNCEKRNPYNGTITTSLDIYNQNGELVIRNSTESVIKTRLGA